MKRCPRCNKQYDDSSLNFCLDDGSPLEGSTFHTDETVVMQPAGTVTQNQWTTRSAGWDASQPVVSKKGGARRALPWVIVAIVCLVVVCGGVFGLVAYLGLQTEKAPENNPSSSAPQINIETPKEPAPAADTSVTIAKFEAIKNGMRRAQVEEIMGRKGTETYSSEIAGMTILALEWKDGPLKMIMVNFQNDKVTQKMQIGLSE